ncbi:MAG: hypothetical protein LIO62_06465 [Clostridiales bacterium]|nr:hypothetical protein [Clostridiales bacterium]
MKIAILTWFNNLNYGTALQAYALQYYLKSEFGATVELINYTPCEENKIHNIHQKTEHFFYKSARKVKKIIHDENKAYDLKLNTVYLEQKKERATNFNSFLFSNISFTKKIKTQNDFSHLAENFD